MSSMKQPCNVCKYARRIPFANNSGALDILVICRKLFDRKAYRDRHITIQLVSFRCPVISMPSKSLRQVHASHLMRCSLVRSRLATFCREVGSAARSAASGSRFSSFTMASATGALTASPSLYTWLTKARGQDC